MPEINEPNGADALRLSTRLLLLPDVTVWTPEIDRLAQQIAKWIRMDLPGGTVFGQQRNGKSRAVIYLGKILAEILGYEVGFLR